MIKTLLSKISIAGTILFSLISSNTNAQVFEVDTILKNGSIDKYINFVYIGDGYTASQQDLYINHITTINDDFFYRVPYANYKNFFNVFAIKVISPQSGVKHPRTAPDCPTAAEFPTANPTNYFGTSFDLWDVHRLIYPVDYEAIDNVMMDNFPAYDQILFIGNTLQYGGAGGAYAVGTAHPLSVEIMLHEVGHSFANLSDEYWAGDGYAGENTNMTHVSLATESLVKWQDWLGVDGVGIYQHCCGGVSNQWYKPHTSCLMEYLENDFCAVCKQRSIEKIYEIVNPIVQYEPVLTSISVSEPMIFKLTEMMLPIPNTLKIVWKLNDVIVASHTDNFTLNPDMLASGTNILIAEVTDTTSMLRVAPTFTHHINNVSWPINGTSSVNEIESSNKNLSVSLFPNPTTDYINVKAKGWTQSKNNTTIEILDVKGATIASFKVDIYNGEFSSRLNISHLAAGNYFLKIVGNNSFEQFKITKL